jgi:hypothetical protein
MAGTGFLRGTNGGDLNTFHRLITYPTWGRSPRSIREYTIGNFVFLSGAACYQSRHRNTCNQVSSLIHIYYLRKFDDGFLMLINIAEIGRLSNLFAQITHSWRFIELSHTVLLSVLSRDIFQRSSEPALIGVLFLFFPIDQTLSGLINIGREGISARRSASNGHPRRLAP